MPTAPLGSKGIGTMDKAWTTPPTASALFGSQGLDGVLCEPGEGSVLGGGECLSRPWPAKQNIALFDRAD